MITILSALSLAAWLYLLLFRGYFWRSGPELQPAKPSGRSKVAVVVPARDEAASICESLTSLLTQEYPGNLSIILVDDNSTDGTGRIAASLGNDNRLTIVNGAPLAPGWSGKLWAVQQGLDQPQAQAANYVLLTDADIVHPRDHISTLVAKAETDRLDLVSEMVHLRCETVAERAFIPAFVFFFQMLYPFSWVANPRRRTAGAAGGTMLVSRAALARIGGASQIRNRLIDDCALAKQVKSTGGTIWLGHTSRTRSLRVYSNFADIWNMIARTAYEQLNYSPLVLAGCVLAMALVYSAPPLLLFARGLPGGLGLITWLLMAISFQPTLRRYRRSPLWGLALPAIGAFYLCATVASAVRHHTGRGGGWKNRVYPPASAE
ncbi:glycosyltransferase [Occallatibacter riparius]|uniref:Glycosyltransferase n=1 Tax=Occallatibacter riparius TaxID=1002689 RepID=A0A9J7BXS4_9BACT|nr:glycosyltransferase [Occallatibacter riparius]UWZ85870.1 glycosyltransferase [Occallatibacter riparius]